MLLWRPKTQRKAFAAVGVRSAGFAALVQTCVAGRAELPAHYTRGLHQAAVRGLIRSSHRVFPVQGVEGAREGGECALAYGLSAIERAPSSLYRVSPMLHNALTSDTGQHTHREVVEEAVADRLMTDAPFGVLLSGGLDSSLVSSIAVRLLRGRGVEKIMSFTIGIEGAPDLVAARKVADLLGTDHHEFYFTPQVRRPSDELCSCR
jgi:hypothetical protein